MEQQGKYRQLQPEERMVIASMTLQGSSTRAIARVLERPSEGKDSVVLLEATCEPPQTRNAHSNET
ncbi:MAG: helix-turn-helix domain-containing protein [Burkholderiales bacterium]|nr:helix-turn-helix domain-containing protein [Burkholderiales bacterium]